MRASLFITCLADHFFAEAGADAVRLLRHLGVEVEFPQAQTCCGQPAFNAGHQDEAQTMARHTLHTFQDAEHVVIPSGSCAAMLRCHYPELLGEDQTTRALADRTFELAEFVVNVLGVTELGRGLEGTRIAYHHGCHALRNLELHDEPLLLLRNAGAEILEWEAAEECCGFGGLFAAKLPEVSAAMADRKLDTLPPTHVLTSADGGCLLQMRSRGRRRNASLPPVRHLARLLWEATGHAAPEARPEAQPE